jgi:hypothetical protein
MTDPPISAPLPMKRRPLKWLTLLLIVVVTLTLCVLIYFRVMGDGRLEEVVAELDRTDPTWRWEDLHRARPQIPDTENSALRVIAAKAKMTGSPGVDDISTWPAEQQMWPALLPRWRAAMARERAALDEAAPLANMPRGRFPMPIDIDAWMSQGFTELQRTRSVVNLLLQNATLHAQEERSRDALHQARAAFNAGRAIGDEPGLISHLVRLACTITTATIIERILAQTQPNADDLLATQKLIELELSEPTFYWAMRGERAWQYEYTTRLQDPRYIAKLSGRELSWSDELKGWLSMGSMRSAEARTLEYLTKIIKICELPAPERRPALEQLRREVKAEASSEDPRKAMFNLLPGYEKYTEAFHRNQALLASAAAALAAERYRLKHGRWPEKLDQLVPEFLTKLPDDPFAPGSLRLARWADGIVIYSVGPDGQDNGGNVLRNVGPAPGQDLGFRLWDVPKRRQPALPPPQGEEGNP